MIKYTHLLLVDDDRDDREIFLAVIENISSAVTCSIAENGKIALDKLVRDGLRPDIIFLDLNMPLMNGREFLTEFMANEELKEIPVIVLSTSSDETVKSELKKLGAMDFITKPDRFSIWEKALRKVL